MNPLAIISVISTVIQVAQAAIQAGKDAAPFINALRQTLGGTGEITQEQLDALEAQIDKLSDELDVPLPPE